MATFLLCFDYIQTFCWWVCSSSKKILSFVFNTFASPSQASRGKECWYIPLGAELSCGIQHGNSDGHGAPRHITACCILCEFPGVHLESDLCFRRLMGRLGGDTKALVALGSSFLLLLQSWPHKPHSLSESATLAFISPTKTFMSKSWTVAIDLSFS